jgi:hypothetical protein
MRTRHRCPLRVDLATILTMSAVTDKAPLSVRNGQIIVGRHVTAKTAPLRNGGDRDGDGTMPRRTKHPIVYVALSPAALATAVSIAPAVVAAAILAGELQVYTRGVARRILISDAENWIRNEWKRGVPRKQRKVPHAES